MKIPPSSRSAFRTARLPTIAECTELGCLFRLCICAAARPATDAAGANRLFNLNAPILGLIAVPVVERSFDDPPLPEQGAEYRNCLNPINGLRDLASLYSIQS